jgi:hypothetical protein
VTTTVTVTGAALGDFAIASFGVDFQGITVTAWVSATRIPSPSDSRMRRAAHSTLAQDTLRVLVIPQ